MKGIKLGTLCFSIILFLISLFFPTFHLLGGPDKYLGFEVLLLGWVGPMSLSFGNYGFIGWYANLFLPFVWLGLARSKSRVASFGGLFLSVISTGLALCSLFLINAGFSVFGKNESESIHNTILSMGFGYYFWLASFVACVLGFSAIIAIDLFKPKKPSTST